MAKKHLRNCFTHNDSPKQNCVLDMCVCAYVSEFGVSFHEIGWYLNFRQSNVYGSSSHLFWIIHGRMQGTPLQTKPVMHISHEKAYLQQICLYIVHVDIYTYIYICKLYYIIFNILGFPTFAFLDIVSKNLVATNKKKRGLEPTMAPATSGSLSAGRHRSSQHFSETRKSKREFATVVLGEPINH